MSRLYAGIIAMLVGALASAEERQLGTLDWQLLVPMPLWQQWTIKVTVALSLAWLLGVLLPRLLFETLPISGYLPRGAFIGGLGTAMLATIVVGSLYISTLCSSGVWALLLSLPAALATEVFLRAVAGPIGDASFELARGGARLPARAYPPSMSAVHAQWFAALPLAGVLALVLWFALVNHRAVDRARTQVALQLSATAAAIIALFAIVGIITGSLYRL